MAWSVELTPWYMMERKKSRVAWWGLNQKAKRMRTRPSKSFEVFIVDMIQMVLITSHEVIEALFVPNYFEVRY